jgi:YVTN family beta-propeller protein
MKFNRWSKFLAVFVLGGSVWSFQLQTQARLQGPSSSGPVAITEDDRFVWVANPDNDSVTVIDVQNDRNVKLTEIPVGKEPGNLAISPNGAFVFVSNGAGGTVSIIHVLPDNPHVVKTIEVGGEPYGLAFTPNGRKVYVANARSNSVTVLDAVLQRVETTIENVGPEPRGLAITNDGDDDDEDEKVYVTQFLATDRPGVLIGRDDYKEGRVTVISTANERVIREIVLNPMADTGFQSNGSAINRVAGTNPATFFFPTGAFPNMLQSIAIKGNRAYLPNTGASPDGPVRFNVNVQSFLSVIDLVNDIEGEAGGQSQALNMNRGIGFEPSGPNRVFPAVPWAIAFKHNSDEGYVVSSSSNFVVKVALDSNGTPTINAPAQAGDPGNIVRIFVGQNPRGITVNSADTRAYVMNEVSRDVSVIDLATNQVLATVQSADLPAAGTPDATLLLGKALFNSSTGVNLPELGPSGVVGNRLSAGGWSSCFACHPNGLTDGVVWIFASGPRRTLPLNGSFNPADPTDIKILNHSAVFDEVQDFELNIRNVSGGQGLITLDDNVTPDPNVVAFNPPNAQRSELLDALTEYVARGIRTPISPFAPKFPASPEERLEISFGRHLFREANCASCHGGGGWSSSRLNFQPPPAAGQIVDTQLLAFLRKVGTFDPGAENEIRANGAPALGAAGFNPPSLLGAFALGPYLHHGAALTLEDVMENVPHRSAGTGGVDILSDPQDRQRLVDFLKTIDATTPPFPIP